MSVIRQFHPVANLFPLMSADQFADLRNDIEENGQHEPIWLHPDGSIIDGRNRYNACTELGIEPDYRTWDGTGSLVQFVVSLNLHRRHLSAEQRAAVAVRLLPMLEEEARARQIAAGATGGRGNKKNLGQKFDQGFSVDTTRGPRAAQEAAAMAGTNRQYVSDAKNIATKAPEVFEMMADGTVNMAAAKQLAAMDDDERTEVMDRATNGNGGKIDGKAIKLARREMGREQRREAAALPSSMYRVWYADPPWSYNNSGVITETDAYGRAERHYPTMSIDELVAMGPDIKARCEPDAVLFLWVTSPLLEDAFPVINAWGFKYKSSFVWDKVRHNFAHYNSMRHEFLLIATRGSCTPDDPKLVDSVQSIERSDRHSEKPEEFRQIIDQLYPYGKRIELFSRTAAEGWDAWGNEPA